MTSWFRQLFCRHRYHASISNLGRPHSVTFEIVATCSGCGKEKRREVRLVAP